MTDVTPGGKFGNGTLAFASGKRTADTIPTGDDIVVDTRSVGVPTRSRGVTALVAGHLTESDEVVSTLRSTGVDTTVAMRSAEALAVISEKTPDVLVVGSFAERDMSNLDLVVRVRSGPWHNLPIIVIGAAGGAVGALEAGADDYLPAPVLSTELVARIQAKITRAATSTTVSRPALSEQRLLEAAEQELRRAELMHRPVTLAAVNFAESERLRARLGSQAIHEIAAAFSELLSYESLPLEVHSARQGGGFLLLLPETNPGTAARRLRLLSRRVSDTVLDIAGEQVRLTPVIGYTSYDRALDGIGGLDASELRKKATVALDEAATHLDLLPVEWSPLLETSGSRPAPARDRLLALSLRLGAPLQITFSVLLVLALPFIVYVSIWELGFDLTTITYPLVAVALGGTAASLWLESLRAIAPVDAPSEPASPYPLASAIVAAYLPNEAATIMDTITTMLAQDYPGRLQVILAYNSPRPLPIEQTLAELAESDPRLTLLKVSASTSKAQNVNAALAYATGEFVGIFDADHHPGPGSFARAWRWLSDGNDIVQGHCVVRNGEASWVARMVAVEFETIYAVSHPGRARLHGFGLFGGSNGYWRRDALRQIRMQRSMLTEDIDSSIRSLREGFKIVSDPALLSSELAPTTVGALWNQRMRWAQGWTQTARRHLRPALRSPALTIRQRLGAGFLLGWAQAMPWITIQVLPMIAFVAWRDHGLGRVNFFVPLFVLLTVFTLTAGAAQTWFAFALGDPRIRRHRRWFVVYAVSVSIWFGEFKNLIARVAQIKELSGERQWRVTPRTSETVIDLTDHETAEVVAPARRRGLSSNLNRELTSGGPGGG
jgi:cellulose synthase/poly-beta-1,6-N-acetylglucosamine synthase-like glycosyltransferase/DNA-binding response OmpR family regulator